MIFYKTSSGGNDFIEVDAAELPKAARAGKAALARALCDRHGGVGADGVVFYRVAGRKAALPGDYAPEIAAMSGYQPLRGSSLKRLSACPGGEKQGVYFEIFNRDGGAAELSGNGMAGLAAVLLQRRLAASPLALRAAIGRRRVALVERNGPVFRLRIEIGRPDFADRGFFPFLRAGKSSYRAGGVEFHPVAVGNPHAVVVLGGSPGAMRGHPLGGSPGAMRLEELGRMLEGHALFPRRVNVEFVEPAGPGRCRVYFYERGVGPTRASSTGSAAVFAVLRRLGQAGDRLEITGADGAEAVEASWDGGIFVQNRTRLVCRGEFFI